MFGFGVLKLSDLFTVSKKCAQRGFSRQFDTIRFWKRSATRFKWHRCEKRMEIMHVHIDIRYSLFILIECERILEKATFEM